MKNEDYTQQEQNKIAKGSLVTGQIEGEGVFRIEGKLKGNLKTSKKIVIGETGIIEGDVICGDADIEGILKGSLIATNSLNLKSTCSIEGDVTTRKLSVEPGANLNGTCTMKDTSSANFKDNAGKSKPEQKQDVKAKA